MSKNHEIATTKTSPDPDDRTRSIVTLPTANGIITLDMDNNPAEIEQEPSPLQRHRPRSLEKHKSRTFTYLDAGFIFKGVATYIFDVVSDILVCIHYFAEGDIWWACLTLVFILMGSVTVQASSFRWFVDDFTQKRTWKPAQGCCRKAFDWLIKIIVHVLQLGTINRYLRCLYYGLKSRKSHTKYYIWKVYEQRDLTMLRLIEAFLEAGPQLVLQIYIMLQLYLSEVPQFYWITAFSAITSLISLSWALEAYHKALRESLGNKHDITYCGIGFRFIWRASMITSRVTALALFALHFKWLIFPVVICHWLLMTIWLIRQETEFYEKRTEERLFCCVIAVVHIFCFFNMKEGNTRLRLTLYYILVLFENTAMAVLWYYFSGMYIHDSYGIVALSFVWGAYFLGITTMVAYYSWFHPNLYANRISGETSQQSTEQVDSSASQDEPDWGGFYKRSHDKRCGNLFTRSGRRYCYWHDDDSSSQETQHLHQPPNVTQEVDADENGNARDVRVMIEDVRNNVNNIIDQQHSSRIQNVFHETSV